MTAADSRLRDDHRRSLLSRERSPITVAGRAANIKSE
jgi:hypothetical protein